MAPPPHIDAPEDGNICGVDNTLVGDVESRLHSTHGLSGAEEGQEALDAFSTDGMKDDIVVNIACNVPGSSSHVLDNSSNQGRRVPSVGDPQPQPTLISRTTPIDEVAHCLPQHGCKDVTSELDFEGCSTDFFVRGGFGVIHKGYLRNGQAVAIKCVEVLGGWGSWKLKEKSIKHAAHELYVWSQCDHPYILRVLGFARFGGHILLVSPWMRNGSLVRYIDQYPQSNRLQLSVELASALTYLHEMGIVHGDIKADNVIMSDDGHVQLGDFGSATLLNYSSVGFTQTGFKGTHRFIAPELLNGTSNQHTTQSDIYALGMTIFQIITGMLPFTDIPEYQISVAVVLMRKIPDRLDFHGIAVDQTARDNLWDLLTRCWAYKPENRPTTMEVKEALVKLERFALIHRTNQSSTLTEPEQPAVSDIHDTSQREFLHSPQSIAQETPTLSQEAPMIRGSASASLSTGVDAMPQLTIPNRQPPTTVAGSASPPSHPEDEVFYNGYENLYEGAKSQLMPSTSSEQTTTIDLIESVGAQNGYAVMPTYTTAAIEFGFPRESIPRSPQKKALLIGLNYAQYDKEFHLRHATDDARRFAAALAKLGYTSENVRVVTDEEDQSPVSCEYLLECMDWLIDGASEGDRLFLMFRGHCLFPNGHNEPYLVAADEKSILRSIFQERLVSKVPGGAELSIVLDCCHAAGMVKLKYRIGQMASEVAVSPILSVPQYGSLHVLQNAGSRPALSVQTTPAMIPQAPFGTLTGTPVRRNIREGIFTAQPLLYPTTPNQELAPVLAASPTSAEEQPRPAQLRQSVVQPRPVQQFQECKGGFVTPAGKVIFWAGTGERLRAFEASGSVRGGIVTNAFCSVLDKCHEGTETVTRRDLWKSLVDAVGDENRCRRERDAKKPHFCTIPIDTRLQLAELWVSQEPLSSPSPILNQAFYCPWKPSDATI